MTNNPKPKVEPYCLPSSSGLSLCVIVVSHQRPNALVRCLKSIWQQDLENFELVVVADTAGIAAIGALKEQGMKFKTCLYDHPNISIARNKGLALAGGAIVAFIDDDAAAEPYWAKTLLSAFNDANVVAATGFVRGRNGISWQWRAQEIDTTGICFPLNVSHDKISTPKPNKNRAIVTIGTNCAFRAKVLRQIGGFDPSYRFYLDETDLNIRLRALGLTAVVPMAQVHHGVFASSYRRANRVPTSLYEIAASTAVFSRRHASNKMQLIYKQLIKEQRSRLLHHLCAMRLSPCQFRHLMQTLHDGWNDGALRELATLSPIASASDEFLPIGNTHARKGRVISSYSLSNILPNKIHQKAIASVKSGKIVSVIALSIGFRRHWHFFTPEGYWLQKGGIWGKGLRNHPLPFGISFRKRVSTEAKRIARSRPII